jgi:hypothetical protein
VECELITLKAFCDVHEVSTFRLAKLSSGYFKMRDELERKQTMLREALARQATLQAGR